MLPVVPSPLSPSSRPTAAHHRSHILQHPQPLDAVTERQGRIGFIEYKLLIFTQLAVINGQHLCDFDTVTLRNGSDICKCWSVECMACIGKAKLMGNPGIRGGFTMQNLVFITMLQLSMLIDIYTPLVIPKW
jgi:hypothetical protein